MPHRRLVPDLKGSYSGEVKLIFTLIDCVEALAPLIKSCAIAAAERGRSEYTLYR